MKFNKTTLFSLLFSSLFLSIPYTQAMNNNQHDSQNYTQDDEQKELMAIWASNSPDHEADPYEADPIAQRSHTPEPSASRIPSQQEYQNFYHHMQQPYQSPYSQPSYFYTPQELHYTPQELHYTPQELHYTQQELDELEEYDRQCLQASEKEFETVAMRNALGPCIASIKPGKTGAVVWRKERSHNPYTPYNKNFQRNYMQFEDETFPFKQNQPQDKSYHNNAHNRTPYNLPPHNPEPSLEYDALEQQFDNMSANQASQLVADFAGIQESNQ